MALKTGSVLQGRYRIAALLGQGGMGAVYRAWDMRLNAPIALKEMIPQPGLDQQTLIQLRQQFQREAQILAQLSHPYLVRVIDFFDRVDLRFVEWEEITEFDPTAKSFFNINTQSDLAEAERLASGEVDN